MTTAGQRRRASRSDDDDAPAGGTVIVAWVSSSAAAIGRYSEGASPAVITARSRECVCNRPLGLKCARLRSLLSP